MFSHSIVTNPSPTYRSPEVHDCSRHNGAHVDPRFLTQAAVDLFHDVLDNWARSFLTDPFDAGWCIMVACQCAPQHQLEALLAAMPKYSTYFHPHVHTCRRPC